MRPIPDSASDLIEELEESYPPRCKDPNETLEQHMHYAGQVALIETMRTRLDWTRQESIVGMPDILKGT